MSAFSLTESKAASQQAARNQTFGNIAVNVRDGRKGAAVIKEQYKRH